MAFTFPLTIPQFMDWLPIAEISFSAPAQVQIAQTAGGEVLPSEIGAQLWRGKITLGRMTRNEARHPDVLLDLLTSGGATFLAYDTRHPAPRLDPTGAILGAASPSIYSLNSNNRELRLQGLPAGYTLTRGDYLSFDYAGRRALHRLVEFNATAAGDGVTERFEVSPKIRPGAKVGETVTLLKASCVAMLVPGQIDKGSARSVITEGMQFHFIQTLKAGV
jgi:hypothetical protein